MTIAIPVLEPEDKCASAFHSVGNAIKILRHLIQQDGPNSLKEVACATGMSPSTAHRYLQCMVQEGLLHQARRSGQYQLGPLAMRLGVAAIEQSDLVGMACDQLDELAAELGFPATVTVWGEQGPVIVRLARTKWAIDSRIAVGARRPVWTTSTGRVFLALMPREATLPLVTEELNSAAPCQKEIDQVIREVRKQGFAATHGTFCSSASSVAAPIVNHQNEPLAVITVISPVVSNLAELEPVIEKLLRFCSQLSVAEAPFYSKYSTAKGNMRASA